MQPAAVLSVLVKADGVAKTAQQVRGFDDTLEKAGLQADQTSRKVREFGRLNETAHISVDTDTEGVDRMRLSLGQATEKANIFGRTVALIKPAAMIAGAGVAAQGLAAIAAGAAAAGAALAPLAGAMAVYPSMLAAVGQGMGVVKLGLLGVSDAMKDFGKALAKPTPGIKNFKTMLEGFIPDIVHLRNLAQGPILRGLTDGIQSASANMPVLAPLVRGTANAIGQLARETGVLIGSSGFGRDLAAVGQRNITIITLLGRAALNVADAVRHVVVAAGPLTLWLARLAAGWAANIQGAAETGRETGRLAAFFESTQAVMSRLFSIAGSLGTAFWNIAKAGKSLGDELLASLDKTTASFARWTASVGGQNKIKEFFENARGPIYEVSKLIRDAVKGFMGLSQQPGLEKMINQIRTGLLPVLVRVVNSTTAAFGPAFIDMVVAVAQAFEPLAGSSGPLVLYVKILTDLARVATWITSNVPGASAAITALVGAMAVSKAAGFAGSITGITKAIVAYRAGAITATATTWAWRASTIASTAVGIAASAATKGMAAAQWLLNAALTANPIGLVILAIAGLVAAFILAWKHSETFRDIVTGAFKGVVSAFGWLWQAAKDVFEWLKSNWPTVLAILTGPIGLAVLMISKHWDAIKSATTNAWNSIKGFLSGVWNAISDAASSTWNAIRGAASSAWGAVRDAILGPIRAARDALEDVLHSIREKLTGAWEAITRSASAAWSSVKKAISEGISEAYDAVKSVASKFIDVGGDIVRGIAQGIRNAASSVISAIKEAVTDRLPGVVKKALGISSPSRVFMEIGRQVPRGMALGITGDAHRVVSAIRAMTPTPTISTASGGPVAASAGMGGAGVTIMGDLVVQDRSDADTIAARLAWLMANG